MAPAHLDPQSARNMAMAAHLLNIIALVLGPLIVWLTQRDSDAWVGAEAKEALNFGISVAIYYFGVFVVGGVLTFVTFGIGFLLLFPLMLAVIVCLVTFSIIAATKASRGESYRYPMTIRVVT